MTQEQLKTVSCSCGHMTQTLNDGYDPIVCPRCNQSMRTYERIEELNTPNLP